MSEVESLNMFYPMSGDKVLVITDFNAYMMEIGSDDVRKIRIDGHEPGDRLSITMFDSDSCFWMLRNDSRLCKYEFLEERMRLLAEYDIIKTSSIWRAADGGVFILQNGDVLQIRKDGTMINHRRSRYPDFWFCATTGSGLTYFLEDHGVWYFDKDNLIKRIPIEVNSPECFYMAADSTLWIGTQSEGIHVFGQDLTKKRTLTVADGLPDNTTRSIIGDESGNIWVSSRCEVYKIDPYTFDVTLYGNPENMSFRYNTNSSSITENGHVLLGSREYIATFSSMEEMEFSNLQVELDGVVLNDVVLEACDKEIEVEYDNNAITFFYSAMNYDPSIRLSYRYKLEGYDDEWVNVGTSKQVQFAGLKHGHYNLIVSVRNPAGVWSDNVLECGFRVKPSPLQSPVALLSYVLISLLVLFALTRLIMKLRNNRLELEHAEHQRILNESLTKEKTDFFTNISHEYRTPLSLIYGPVTELAGSNSLNDHDKYLLSLVLQNTERMMKLTDQVLNFYSFDKERLKIMKLDVSSFLKTMLSSFEYMFMQKELTLLVEVPEGIKAYCDREKIERIFFNIISNAVKYTPEGGEITVKAGLTDDLLNISVTDTGIGIPPEKMRKIFDRFERADVENSGLNESGFGIGLNYAMHLAVLHKGYLSVSPNVPKGSVFTISLPASKSCYDPEFVILDTESSNEKAIISNETDSGVKEMTVLVAEDNVELASYIRHLLIKDYNVILAANGNEALEFIQVSAPDIIISDIMMPYKDGYSLCSEIKSSSEFCHLPVILLTAKTDSESHIKGLDLGADAFIKKPFTPELLLTTLKGLIDNRKRLQNILSGKVLSGDPVSPEDIRTMKVNSHDRIFVERLHAMMEEHLDDEDFNVMAMAKEFAMSRTSLFSKMKSLFGVSPQTWLTDYRLTKAMELLKTREFNVSEVSYKVGFSTLTGFSRSFKNKFGVPPSSI